MARLLAVFLLLLFSQLFFLPQPARAQGSGAAEDAYQYLQKQRARARAVVGRAESPAPDSLQKAVRILQGALGYYEQPGVTALARSHEPLRFRQSDIQFDLAVVQSRLGQAAAAVASLRELLTPELAEVYAPAILNHPALAPVRSHPVLQPSLDRATTLLNVFDSKALATDYRPNLTDAEKVAGLSKLWSEAKYNFAYFDHLPGLDWDRAYLEYLPRVQVTTNTVAYYRVLQQFYAQLRDGHTDVWAPAGPVADSVYGRPPITAELVAGRVLVQQVRSDSLQRTGIVPGLEIVRIEGLPATAYADRYVRPYQSGSTPQNVDAQTYTYHLLSGPKTRPVRVEFRDKKGRQFARLLPRRGYGQLAPNVPVRLRFLPGNVAYLQVNEFETDAGWRRFVAALDSIQATRALVIDLRQNGGGNSSNGYRILNYLTDQPYRVGRYQSRIYSAVGRARGQGLRLEAVDTANFSTPARPDKHYAKPVVVLISGQTFSAAEDFCSAYVGLRRGALIGEPTGGSTGQPLSFALPGGLMARVCTKRDTYPDGTEWNGQGIQPTLLVRPTVRTRQAGEDPVLAAALQYLSKPAGAGKRSRAEPRQGRP
jgi:C-terminal processing protease CtpA/Prc/tetratricopeptide (TPR) repeat protein